MVIVSVIRLNVVMASVILMSIVMLRVMAPFCSQPLKIFEFHFIFDEKYLYMSNFASSQIAEGQVVRFRKFQDSFQNILEILKNLACAVLQWPKKLSIDTKMIPRYSLNFVKTVSIGLPQAC